MSGDKALQIVCLGNCQAQAVGNIIQRFVSPYILINVEFVDAYHNVDQTSYNKLCQADIVLAQVSRHETPLDQTKIPAYATVHRFPLVSGAFLWPYHCVQHPLRPTARYGNPPYQPEYNDRYLVGLIHEKTLPAKALEQYKSTDVAAAAHVGRLYELTLERQRAIDAECGYDCAGIIESYLPHQQLFQSAFHFSGRIARHIASTVCERIGFDLKYAQRIRDHLKDAPFVPRFVPVHPSIARYFGMTWVKDHTTYPFLWEGAFTFDEYVLRFMEAKWSASLQEGIIDARQGKHGAREKLERGVDEAPRSPEGFHELSRLIEAEGDLPKALAVQQHAVHLGGNAAILIRCAKLLQKTGDLKLAATMLRRATEADPVSHHAWALRRDVLTQLGRTRLALLAAEKVAEFKPDPAAVQAAAALIAQTSARP